MPITELLADATAVDLARECVYRFLAGCLADPRSEAARLAVEPGAQDLACQAAELLREEAAALPLALGFGELPPDQLDLRALRAGPDREAEYDRVFGVVCSRECPPYETEYHSTAEPFFRAQRLADIAGFYRAFGLEPSPHRPEPPDHLALELEFMALLLLKKRLARTAASDPDAAEHAAVCAAAESRFFQDHLAWWVPAFATGLRRKGEGGYYTSVGRVLAALIPAERVRLAVPAPRVPIQPILIERPEEQPGCASCAGSS